MPRRLLPEWEAQDGVLLTWPHPGTDWAGFLEEAETTYLEIALAISRHEHVLIVAQDAQHATSLTGKLTGAGIPGLRYTLGVAASNDTWARDHGPITVGDGDKITLLDFGFNGWGGKYAHHLDNQITRTLHRQGCFGSVGLESNALILEGGGIETDGCGTLLVTRSCLLAPTRNPELDQRLLEQQLRETLGVERFLWLDADPLPGDDTDGHIDTLARFCDPETIAYIRCDDPADPHFTSLQHLEEQLQAMETPRGNPYRLIPLPWPNARFDDDGRRLPATYANFLIINHAVLAPTYGDAADTEALAALQRCFPDREIIGIDCSTLIRQNGSLHCITMQLPRGTLFS